MSSFSKSTQITSFSVQFYFFLFLLINIIQFPLACHGCHEKERRALLDFKYSLEDPANRLASWLEGNKYRNCCSWKGIGCSSDSARVISINLRNTVLETRYNEDPYGLVPPPNTALKGNFFSSLVNITHLEYVDLAFNNFQESQIPFQFSELTTLVHLDLSYSNFSDSASAQFTSLSSLQYLDLSCGFIVRLRRYDLISSCVESSSLKWLRGLVNLKVLSLREIDLYEAASSEKNFAESISYLSNLRNLDLSSCNISSTVFPIHEFRNLTHLSSLRLSGNDLSFQIPVQLLNLTSLSTLYLSGCELQGSVPYLPQLKELDVSETYGLHTDFLTKMFRHQWPKLQRLSISLTNVGGPIPNSISNAPVLASLSAFECSIQGSLPSSIYNLSRLQSLDLGYNNITGHIHSSICDISSLRELWLDENNITGTIPRCLTKLQHLGAFSVYKNSIEGTVSLVSFMNDLNLTYLDLGLNRLTVVTDEPSHRYSRFKLQHLVLSSCNLKGLIPSVICNLTHLNYLDLSHNNLTGIIPSCISKLKLYSRLNLSHNKLRGSLPLPPDDQFNDYVFNDFSFKL
ncbi:hypothetical protein MKW92_044003 [Papaver armeniacum]|nr:hypothetical protein MKW92_044003 [Papaver armeniacum]